MYESATMNSATNYSLLKSLIWKNQKHTAWLYSAWT